MNCLWNSSTYACWLSLLYLLLVVAVCENYIDCDTTIFFWESWEIFTSYPYFQLFNLPFLLLSLSVFYFLIDYCLLIKLMCDCIPSCNLRKGSPPNANSFIKSTTFILSLLRLYSWNAHWLGFWGTYCFVYASASFAYSLSNSCHPLDFLKDPIFLSV